MYLVTIPGSQLPKSLEFPKCLEWIKVSFVTWMRWLLEGSKKCASMPEESVKWLDGWNFQLHCWLLREDRLETESITIGQRWINCDYVMKPL